MSPAPTINRFIVVLVLYLSSQLWLPVSAQAACYYPNGNLQPNDVPCNPAAKISPCCARGWSCLSNGVCMLTQDTVVGEVSRVGATFRGSCTDKSWKSSQCHDFCKNANPSTSQAVSSCGEHKWCCQDTSFNATYCCLGNTFPLDPIKEQAVQIPLSSGTGGTSVNILSSTPASVSTSTPSVTALNTSTRSTTNKHQSVAVGVCLGVPLVLAMLAILFFVVQKHRRINASDAFEEHAAPKENLSWSELSGDREFELPAKHMAVEICGEKRSSD